MSVWNWLRSRIARVAVWRRRDRDAEVERERAGHDARGRRDGDKPDPGLPKIAAATGGGYFELTTTKDLAETFKRVADELHRQYALGFAPATLDGKMHALQVRVAGTGATVRARRSYLASKA